MPSLLSFKDTDAFPAGFPAHRLLRARFARQASWFAGSFYPTFWYFDTAGVLRGQSLGFMPEEIDAWLLGAGELGSKPTELESSSPELAAQENN